MVSAQIPGKLDLYARTAGNQDVPLGSYNIKTIGNGGSSEGAIVNSIEKWMRLKISPLLKADTRLKVAFTPVGAATTDQSDGIWLIPYILANGVTGFLEANSTDFDKSLYGDEALVAKRETILGVSKKMDMPWRIGGAPVFMSVENNA